MLLWDSSAYITIYFNSSQEKYQTEYSESEIFKPLKVNKSKLNVQ